MKLKAVLLSSLMALSLSALTVGETPKNVSISAESGGMVVDGSLWNSSTIKDNVFVMFYVDPDEKDVNEHYSQALKAEKEAERLSFKSIAVINLAATWNRTLLSSLFYKVNKRNIQTRFTSKTRLAFL